MGIQFIIHYPIACSRFSTVIIVMNELINSFCIFVPEENRCANPNLQNGTCIPLRNCSHLYQLLLTEPLTAENRNFLAQSQCAFRDRTPYVSSHILLHSINKLYLQYCGIKTNYLIYRFESLRYVALQTQPHQIHRTLRMHLQELVAYPQATFHHQVHAALILCLIVS